MLFRDGLHSILAFLTLEETAAAARACRSWAAAVASEPSKRIATRCCSWQHLSPFVRRHTSALTLKTAFDRSRLAKEMTCLAQALPALTQCEIELRHNWGFRPDLQASEAAALRTIVWPSGLRTLRIHAVPLNTAAIAIFDSIGCPPLALTDLHLEWRHDHLAAADLAPLLHVCSTLLKFTLISTAYEGGVPSWSTLPDRQVDILKQLGALRELLVHIPWSTGSLARLVAEPSPITASLTTLFVSEWDFVHSRLDWSSLCHLPHLTRLRPSPIVVTPEHVVRYLTVVPHLASLVVRVTTQEMLQWLLEIATMERHPGCGTPLRHLTELELFVPAHWSRDLIPEPHQTAEFLQTMPLLRRLSLVGVDLSSLSCLAHMTYLATLSFDLRRRTVDYQNAEEIPTLSHVEIDAYIVDLRRLPSLTDLRVRSFGGWIEGPDDSDCLEQLRTIARRVRLLSPVSLTGWAEPLLP